MVDYRNVESLMELHNIDKTMIEDGACVQMNRRGDWNIADCGETAHLVCEYALMTCGEYDNLNSDQGNH